MGVALAWGPDYLLTERDDLMLVRYNNVAGAVTALCYRQVDAIAVEQPIAVDILACIEGLYKKHSLRSQRRRCLGGSDRHVRHCKAKGLRPQYSRKDPHNVRVLSLVQVENSLKTLTRRW